MNDYPDSIVPVNHVAPVPRRIRAFLGGEKVLDTSRALYVWEWPNYPQYYIPLADVRADLLQPDGHPQQTARGVVEVRGLRAGLPVRLVASAHDTSVAMIEKHYGAFIVDATEDLLRRAAVPLAPTRGKRLLASVAPT